MKFSGNAGNVPVNKRLILVAIRITVPDLDPYRDTAKTCIGGGTASSLIYISVCQLGITLMI